MGNVPSGSPLSKIDQLQAEVASLHMELDEEQKRNESIMEEYKKCQNRLQEERKPPAQKEAERLERLKALKEQERVAMDQERKLREQREAALEHERQKPVQYVNVVGKRQRPCMGEYRGLKELGRGANGVVSQVCKEANCQYVMKVQPLDLKVNEQEVTLSKYIFSVVPNIIPQTYNAWECESKFFIVSDRYDTNMQKVGERQYTSLMATGQLDPAFWPDSLFTYALTEDQLLQMFAICEILSSIGIAHGDVKPDNFLYRDATKRVVTTDMGCAGFINQQFATRAGLQMIYPFQGWTGNLGQKCPKGTINRSHPWFKYLPLLNTWQLTVALIIWPTVIDMGYGVVPRFRRFRHAFFGSREHMATEMYNQCANVKYHNRLRELDQRTNVLPVYTVLKANLDAMIRRLTS